ncbi:MAG: spondin domain-containing protein [Proteobacteria bacterium]|nr:spondin domain-containing protein [Pseudomonadota bacterium]
MKNFFKRLCIKTAFSATAVLLLGSHISGCSNSSSSPPAPDTGDDPISYEVSVINATNNQPISPVAVITHNAGYSLWSIGSAASTELEYIAEGGSNSQLMDSLDSEDATAVSGKGAIGPGGSETISITAGASEQTRITVLGMLVNTNDAFSGIRSVDVSALASGESISLNASVYDAGTEINSESSGTMPGPADGGEGFNAARSDTSNIVRYHGGVVSADDGLSASVLDQSHRFDNPALVITITRI